MSFDDIRPILSGLIGGVIAIALGCALSRWMPKSFQGKSADQLLRENRFAIKMANILSLIGIFGALALYQWGDFARNDWRPLALGFGFAFSVPFVSLPLSALVTKRHTSEAFVAYALSKKVPVPVLFTLLSLGIPLLFLAVWSLLP
jgi:hypothetical protein